MARDPLPPRSNGIQTLYTPWRGAVVIGPSFRGLVSDNLHTCRAGDVHKCFSHFVKFATANTSPGDVASEGPTDHKNRSV